MIDALPPARALPEPTPRPVQPEARGNFGDWLQSPVEQEVPAELGDAQVRSQEFPVESTQPAGAVQAIVPMQVELQLRSATGQTETLCVPWRLAATGRLEWSSSLGQGPAALPDIPSIPLQPIGPREPIAAGGAQVVVPEAVLPLQSRQMPQMAYGLAQVESDRIGAEDERVPALSRHLLALAADSWRERLVRWAEQQGRDPAVWIRDYRLDGPDAQHLVDSLRARANEHGFSLERILVNAREMWRAKPNIPETKVR